MEYPKYWNIIWDDYFLIIIFVGVDEKSFHISFVYAFIIGTCRCVNEMFTLSMPYIHLPP